MSAPRVRLEWGGDGVVVVAMEDRATRNSLTAELGDEMEAAAIVLVVVTVAVATAAVATAVEEVEAVVLTDRVTARAGTPRKPARGRQHGLSKIGKISLCTMLI